MYLSITALVWSSPESSPAKGDTIISLHKKNPTTLWYYCRISSLFALSERDEERDTICRLFWKSIDSKSLALENPFWVADAAVQASEKWSCCFYALCWRRKSCSHLLRESHQLGRAVWQAKSAFSDSFPWQLLIVCKESCSLNVPSNSMNDVPHGNFWKEVSWLAIKEIIKMKVLSNDN